MRVGFQGLRSEGVNVIISNSCTEWIRTSSDTNLVLLHCSWSDLGQNFVSRHSDLECCLQVQNYNLQYPFTTCTKQTIRLCDFLGHV